MPRNASTAPVRPRNVWGTSVSAIIVGGTPFAVGTLPESAGTLPAVGEAIGVVFPARYIGLGNCVRTPAGVVRAVGLIYHVLRVDYSASEVLVPVRRHARSRRL